MKKELEQRIEALEKQLLEYKRREEQIEIAENIYGAFIENANDCILTIDTQGIIQSVNTCAVKKIGYPKEEIRGKRFIEFVSGKYVTDAGKLLKVIFKDGKSIKDFVINLKSNITGSFPVELNISPLYDNRGKVTLIQVIARDISESVKPEDESICDKCNDMIYYMMDGFILCDKDLTILKVNKEFEEGLKRNFKMDVEDVIGKNMLETIPNIPKEKIIEIVRKVIKTGKPEKIDKFVYPINEKDVLLYKFKIYKAGDGLAIIYRDITESELFKENLEIYSRKLEESNIKLELANASKSEFLANTTHELRTPLNSIIGFLKLIIDGMIKNKQEEREILNDAYNSAMHLLSIINNILDIAKIEAGKIETHPKKVNIIDLLNEVKSVTHIQAVMKKLSITFDTGSLLYPYVLADHEMLKQVFINVIGNSIKFTDKGEIDIKVLPEVEDGLVIINITDTGIGFKEENIEKLFDKFKQADGSFTRKKGGTGLGLAISKSLIEMMQGKISLYSEGVGKGAKAIIKIPAYKNDGYSQIGV